MGEVFAGRYELVDPIGRGGAGEVWRAWDHRRCRYVAAKVLQQRDAHSLLRFVREQALRIDHPYVLAPTSWAADDDKVLFTMDLVRGGSVAHLIGDCGALPPRLVVTLLDQLLAGLTAVHAEGVVHRDIKPANLLLEATGTGEPHLRLSDFGIAVRTGDPRLTETHYVVGTPGYVAPEQMLGADPDYPQDLFGVGLVALYMLTGEKPDTEALVDSYASGGFPSAPEGVPHGLWQVVASLLNPDPQARFRTAVGARKALAAAREMLPAPSSDEEPIEVFDQLGPLPDGYGPNGPLRPAWERTADGGGPARNTVPLGGGTADSPPAPRAPYVSPAGGFVLAHPGTPSGGAPGPPGPGTPGAAGGAETAATGHPPTRPSPGSGPASAAPSAQPAPGFTSVPPARTPHGPSSGQSQQPPWPHGQAPTRPPRPAPPLKVVVPVLVAAAVCFAVGVWALLTG